MAKPAPAFLKTEQNANTNCRGCRWWFALWGLLEMQGLRQQARYWPICGWPSLPACAYHRKWPLKDASYLLQTFRCSVNACGPQLPLNQKEGLLEDQKPQLLSSAVIAICSNPLAEEWGWGKSLGWWSQGPSRRKWRNTKACQVCEVHPPGVVQGHLAVYLLYINLQSGAKHCLSPVTRVFQAASTAASGWFGKVCALKEDPNLWVLSPGAQFSRGFSPPPLLLAPTTSTVVLAEAGGKSPNTVAPKVPNVYWVSHFFFKALLVQEPLPTCQ